MIKIPVAFILFAVLLLIAANLWRHHRDNPAARPFMILMLLAALQTLMVGLRWEFGLSQLRIGQAVGASILPPAAWLAFQTAASGRKPANRTLLLHLVVPVFVIIAMVLAPDAIDFLIAVSFMTYGALFLGLARAGDERFARTAFEGMFNMRLAIWLLAFTLIGSAVIDMMVFVDFMQMGGNHAAGLISIGTVMWLLATGISVALGSQGLSQAMEAEEPAANADPGDEDVKNAQAIHALLAGSSLIKDPGLNLSRLARRAGLPLRAVSSAINRVHGCNVSQFINAMRIENACSLIADSGMSITEAIYASGFQTKSNFNREFLRVKGRTPSDWRKELGRVP